MDTKIIAVTPAMAKDWLGKNFDNRVLTDKRIVGYANEMKLGKWHLTHQGVAFFEDGSFADGQHRLYAIIKSGCTIDLLVTTGIQKQAASVIDSHQQRQAHQSLKMAGFDWIDKDKVATIKMMITIHQHVGGMIQNQEVIDFGIKHKEKITFTHDLVKTKKRGLTAAFVLAAVACAYPHEDKEELKAFLEVLSSGMPRSEKDKAAILLREWLLSNKVGGHTPRLDAVKRIMRAIMAFCQKQEISRLIQPDEFLYRIDRKP